MSIFEHFSALDGLAQVIYQDKHRFVLLSRVHHSNTNKSGAKEGKGKQPATEDASELGWQTYIGLANDGRWWCGWWREADLKALTGPKPAAKLLNTFATNLIQTIVKGELFVSNAKDVLGSGNSKEEESLQLVFGPTSSKPLDMTLNELSIEEIGSFAAREFFTFAMNAQSRDCRIFPAKDESQKIVSKSKRAPSTASPSQEHKSSSAASSKPQTPPRKRRAVDMHDTESDELQKLRRELEIAKRQAAEAKAEAERLAAQQASDPEDKPVLLRPNPYRRVRKLQTMEFESDEE